MSRPESANTAIGSPPDRLRRAEAALRRLGFSRVDAAPRAPLPTPDFWVQESGVPRRTFPVYLRAPSARSAATGASPTSGRTPAGVPSRAIVVVDGEGAAEQAWHSLRASVRDPAPELSVLVLPTAAASAAGPRWHLGTLPPRDLLRLCTGVVVGLFQRAAAEEGSSQIDFSEMLALLRRRFGVDVHRSLGVTTDEDALYLLYQLAQRETYAPGDSGANLHALVLKPVGPAARLPWFAA